MKYLSGVLALNIHRPSDDTDGDWHETSIDWQDIDNSFKDTKGSVFKDYGVIKNIKHLDKIFNVANHVRACLDLIDELDFEPVGQMRDAYINNEKYTKEIFDKIYSLKVLKNTDDWSRIDKFMLNEYTIDWYNYTHNRD